MAVWQTLSVVDEVCSTPADDVLRHARAAPDKVLYTWLDEDGDAMRTLSYAQAAGELLRLAARLEATGARGRRVVCVFPPGVDFFIAFLACFCAGCVPVACYPPQRSHGIAAFEQVMEDCGASLVLTNSFYEHVRHSIPTPEEQACDAAWLHAKWVAIDDCEDFGPSAQQEPREVQTPDWDDTAFLQYTSGMLSVSAELWAWGDVSAALGSTAEPKGVVITWRNLRHNQVLLRDNFAFDGTHVYAASVGKRRFHSG